MDMRVFYWFVINVGYILDEVVLASNYCRQLAYLRSLDKLCRLSPMGRNTQLQ